MIALAAAAKKMGNLQVEIFKQRALLLMTLSLLLLSMQHHGLQTHNRGGLEKKILVPKVAAKKQTKKRTTKHAKLAVAQQIMSSLCSFLRLFLSLVAQR